MTDNITVLDALDGLHRVECLANLLLLSAKALEHFENDAINAGVNALIDELRKVEELLKEHVKGEAP